jgi:transposase, IS30 family
MPGLPLSVYEREQLHVMLAIDRKVSWAAMARRVERDPSTVQREIERNGGRNCCRPSCAQKRFERHKTRPKPLQQNNDRLRVFATKKLREGMSPNAVAFLATAAGIPVGEF